MPRKRRAARRRKLNFGLRDEDETDEQEHELDEQLSYFQNTQQPMEKQDIAPSTQKSTRNQSGCHSLQVIPRKRRGATKRKLNCRLRDEVEIDEEEHELDEQQSKSRDTQQPMEKQATRNQSRCHNLQDKHQVEGHKQHENEKQPGIDMTEQTNVQQGSKRGPTYLPDIWARRPNEGRILVSFNKRGQPIGPNKKKLTGFLGTLARNGKFVPLDIEDWRKVPKVRKDEMIKIVKERFEIPIGGEHWILLSIAKKRRHWKSRVKTEYFESTLPDKNQVYSRPIRVNENQWKNLLPHWTKEYVKEISVKNKNHRRLSIMQQTTGKLSFAEVEDELRELLGRSPSRVEMFDACYTDSNGNPSNDAAGDALAQMKEHQSKLLSDTQDNIGPDYLFAKVRGKDPHGRVRMLGLGVNPSDMWGGIPSRSACYRMVLENQVALARMEEKMDRAFADFQQKMQQQTFTPPPPASPVQSSNSISVGNKHQVGGSVFLKSVFDSSKIVAKGFLRSVDPNQKVGGRRLGSNWYEVEISTPVDWDEDLIRPYSNISTIGEAIGICVAWPRNLVAHDNDGE